MCLPFMHADAPTSRGPTNLHKGYKHKLTNDQWYIPGESVSLSKVQTHTMELF